MTANSMTEIHSGKFGSLFWNDQHSDTFLVDCEMFSFGLTDDMTQANGDISTSQASDPSVAAQLVQQFVHVHLAEGPGNLPMRCNKLKKFTLEEPLAQ